MTPSAKSVFYFGIYITLAGLSLLFFPNFLLSVIGLENTNEVWIRFAGILLTELSVYYIIAAKKQLFTIFRVTVFTRCTIIILFSALVYLEMMKPVMLAFGAIDFAGGVWTYLAMKKERIW